MKTLIEAPFLVAGDEMELLRGGYILIDNNIISEVGTGEPPSAERRIRHEQSIAIPGLINAHTHIGDSALKDAGFGRSLNELFKPPDGLKHRLLRDTGKDVILRAVKDTLTKMLTSGTTTFVDFREGSVDGARILFTALWEQSIRALIFGRPDYTFDTEQLSNNRGAIPADSLVALHELLSTTHGLAPSSPNDITDEALQQLAEIAKEHRKLRATHAAENPESERVSKSRTGLTEVERAVEYFDVDLLVHLIYASQRDLDLVAERDIPVAVCPRANASLGLRLPPIPEMLDRGITVCLGTDNVMLNQPDMFREMEFTLKAYRIEKTATRHLSPKEILKMATINGARALKIDDETGSIKEGKSADLTVIDLNRNLKNTKDLLAALTHRAGAEDVSSVLIGGKIVFDMGKSSRGNC